VGWWKCSECGKVIELEELSEYYYCGICGVISTDFVEAEAPPPPPEPPETEAPSPPPEPLESDDLQKCLSCGAKGHPGEECPQCSEIIPIKSNGTKQFIVAQMPLGELITIPCEQEVIIGRNSGNPEIDKALSSPDFNDEVSRKHCYVKINAEGTLITVRDPGSTNHTWVGDDPNFLRVGDLVCVSLPISVRLGKLTIKFERVSTP
jgi:predicted RNA-binding Zn-ribbon protein involved in translation (DUF1610 family)